MLYIVFNKKNSLEDLGLGILTSNEHKKTEEEIDYISIERRREGALTVKTGNFKDIVFTRTFRIIDGEEKDLKMIKINKWINEIVDNRLYFSDYVEKCCKVKSAIVKSVKDDNRNIVNIEIEFTCNPFLYKTNEDYEEYENNSIIYNFGDEISEPLIRIKLPSTTGNIQLTIGDNTLEVRNVKNDLFIESSLFRAISEGIEVRTIGNFPLLNRGENNLSWVGNIDKLEINKNTLYRV